jgi:hypothetical protein
MGTHDLIDHLTWRGAAETSMPIVLILVGLVLLIWPRITAGRSRV